MEFYQKIQENVKSVCLLSEKHTKAEENNFSLFHQNLISLIWREGEGDFLEKCISA